MNHSFEQKLTSTWSVEDWADVTVLAAVSGGTDSMALLRATHSLRTSGSGRLVVIHFNHRLRGAESEADESFVREHAARLNLTCDVGYSTAPSGTQNCEDAARRSRYDFFCRAAKEWGARFVVTAHTADDQAETILQRILRGTGIDGLAGIPKSRELLPGVSLIRPLLAVSRTEVLGYLQSIGQPFRHDSSNAESRFTRNRLRNELIPSLERDYNPRVKEALIRLGQLAEESQGVIANAARALWQRAVECVDEQGATIRCEELSVADGYLVRQMIMDLWRECGWGLRDMSGDHWRQLAELAVTKTGGVQSAIFPGGVRAERDGAMLYLVAASAQGTK